MKTLKHIFPISAFALILSFIITGACFKRAPINPDKYYHGPLKTKPYHFQESDLEGLPWEVRGPGGEFHLPDVYYAEKNQNRQIMPLEIDVGNKKPYSIDRLIYPTIGNPNLYVKEGDDTLIVVLRIEKDILKKMGLSRGKALQSTPYLRPANFSSHGNFKFFLLPKSERNKSGSLEPLTGKISLKPARVLIHTQDNMPPELTGRETLQFHFNEAALGLLEADLYDLRFELAPKGEELIFEYQYNAVRIYEKDADTGPYSVINITDSQVSVSELLDGVVNKVSFREISLDKLRQFVNYINSSKDKRIRNAAFITFNGDLHNGGSPGTLMPNDIAETYQKEAGAVLKILSKLKTPIFLTAGNHDGYASMGHTPKFIETILNDKKLLNSIAGAAGKKKPLENVINDVIGPEAWENLNRYLQENQEIPGGRHVDIFTGSFIRRGRPDRGKTLYWQHIPIEHQNQVIYDGFNQWRKTYGPLAYSWGFGKNHYININSYDLRQHRRSGWGMYTVNYGGGISQFQMNWIRRDIYINDTGKKDIILLAHHDPRGGHNGKDHPYYFRQIDYTGMGVSASAYIKGEILNPVFCDKIPGLIKTKKYALDCLHDGLQEWMRPDIEFDCENEHLYTEGPLTGRCDPEEFRSTTFFGNKNHPLYSGYQMLHRLAKYKSIRTLLLGHTHYNSLEILQPGDEIVPGKVTLDYSANKRYAQLEVDNPLRANSYEKYEENTAKLDKLSYTMVEGKKTLTLDLLKAGHDFNRKLNEKELAILRLTSIAELTLQESMLDGSSMVGFTVFDVYSIQDKRNYALPQINKLHYYQSKDGSFLKIAEVPLRRTDKWKAGGADNPLKNLFIMPDEK